jgi:hypothetical protein
MSFGRLQHAGREASSGDRRGAAEGVRRKLGRRRPLHRFVEIEMSPDGGSRPRYSTGAELNQPLGGHRAKPFNPISIAILVAHLIRSAASSHPAAVVSDRTGPLWEALRPGFAEAARPPETPQSAASPKPGSDAAVGRPASPFGNPYAPGGIAWFNGNRRKAMLSLSKIERTRHTRPYG